MESIIWLIIYLVIAAWLIYDPEALGGYVGAARGHYISKQTPGCVMRAAGCCMMAAVPARMLGNLLHFAGLPLWASLTSATLVGAAGAIGLYILALRLFE